MLNINPSVKNQFNSLSPELQSIIEQRNVELNTIQDLIRVLEEITNEIE